MLIGKFMAKDNGEIEGVYDTITAELHLTLSPKKADGPDYIITKTGTQIEVGVAYDKVSKSGNPFITVSLDDPTFAKRVYANLIMDQHDSTTYKLLWDRPKSRSAT
ncbi:MAG: DUF736 family protein [Kordiimonadaceae bacterium]|nr:DUF736 family protein [Kordiimonadaceae bacterium]